MEIKKTIDYIIRDLDEAREIIDDFKNYPGVPLLQVELAKSKCRSAEELIKLLSDYKQNEDAESDKADKQSGTVIISSEPADLIEIDNDESSEGIENEPVNEYQVPVSRETDIADKPVTSQTVKTILSDRYRDNSANINDQIGSKKTDMDVNSAIREKPITNLFEAIGLNDRFFYVREIFSGDHASYENAIKKLNNVRDLNDAKAVLLSYTGQIKDDSAFSQLMDLVKRKISVNE